MDVTIDGCICKVDLDNKIGGGSFGAVYAATSDGEEGAVKRVPKERGAQRELLVVEGLGDVPNVVPVHGIGDAGDSWAIVMPHAEQSLCTFLRTAGGPLESPLALPILLDIAQALVSLKSKGVVHRGPQAQEHPAAPRSLVPHRLRHLPLRR
ncbi:MAG TPA: protein kinase, partial [Propionibacteriaceae bacterium]|nr:protein kinase [Propionibacteriaceae bacterium]